MIQRIQSVYMLLAVVFTVVCLCMQIGTFSVAGLPVMNEFNLWCTDLLGGRHFLTWPLFAVLVLSSAIGFCTIFLYRNRRLQARICVLNALLLLGWYILYAVFAQVALTKAISVDFVKDLADASFRPAIAAALPVISFLLYIMARRSILADEKLVKAADRIR